MSDRDEPRFEPRIADWLMADPEIAPTQILETVASALPSIPQRRGLRPRSYTRAAMSWVIPRCLFDRRGRKVAAMPCRSRR